MKLLNLLFWMTSILLVSCDPPHNIYFINHSVSSTEVTLKMNPKFENYKMDQIVKGDSIYFNIRPKDTASIQFGIGDWSDGEIENISKSIKYLKFENEDLSTIYKSDKSIQNLFKENRKGFWFKTMIYIEIK